MYIIVHQSLSCLFKLKTSCDLELIFILLLIHIWLLRGGEDELIYAWWTRHVKYLYFLSKSGWICLVIGTAGKLQPGKKQGRYQELICTFLGKQGRHQNTNKMEGDIRIVSLAFAFSPIWSPKKTFRRVKYKEGAKSRNCSVLSRVCCY